jgi:hypothetical protein
MTTGSWWRQIAVDQLLVDPSPSGSWAKIICANLGIMAGPGNTWEAKIANHLSLGPHVRGYEELGKVIYLAGSLIHP